MAFDSRWEQEVYGKGRHLNLYPYDLVVSAILSNFAGVTDRSAVKILEVGCGAGNNVWFLAREGFSASGVDGSVTAISFARARLESEHLSADLRVGDFRQLEWGEATFDAVVDRGAITHNRRREIIDVLCEVHRVLKPSGLFVSQIFSECDTGRGYGKPQGDGSFDEFCGGYFADIALTFFASFGDIDQLFDDRFQVQRKEHHVITAEGSDEVTAFWNILSRKKRREDD